MSENKTAGLTKAETTEPEKTDQSYHLRFHKELQHLEAPFGPGWFGTKAEAFAHAFGTPKFLLGQTVIVIGWIFVNALAVALRWDPYPFILLNLMFSLQSAYAAPLILLAQSRQALRDKASQDADAKHREDIAKRNTEQNERELELADQMMKLLAQNTELTQKVEQLTSATSEMTKAVHKKLC